MKTKFALKAGFAAVALAAAGAANAGFYIDSGVDVGGVGIVDGKVCATCTSVKTELQFKYDSTTRFLTWTTTGLTLVMAFPRSAALLFLVH